MDQPAPAYQGQDSFVFVSYSHQDEALVYREIRWLQDKGVNVWYDTKGIGPGTEWNDEIAKAIQDADRFIFFITPKSVASEHCRRELNFAQAEGCTVLAVHLEPTDVPAGLRLSLDNRQAIFRYRLDEDDYQSTLLRSLTSSQPEVPPASSNAQPQNNRRTKKAIALAAGLVTIVSVLALLQEDEAPSDSSTDSSTASSVTDAPGAGLDPAQTVELGGTSDTQAYAHYVVGKELFNVDPDRALTELQQAVEVDPEFALAWIYIAFSYGSLSRDPDQTAAALAEMSTATARAVSEAPDLWQAQDALGWYLLTRRDFVGADRAFEKSVELAEAANTLAHPGYTQYLAMIGRYRERQARIEKIRDADPLFPIADNLYMLGRREEARAELDRARGTRTYIGGVAWWEALEETLAIERGDAKELDKLIFAGTDLVGLWGSEAFLDALRDELASNSEPPRNHFLKYAIYSARHGDTELALDLLRREYLRDGVGGHAFIWHPLLADVRATKGFKSFLRDYGIIEMFQDSGKWNDYCQPTAGDDFECH